VGHTAVCPRPPPVMNGSYFAWDPLWQFRLIPSWPGCPTLFVGLFRLRILLQLRGTVIPPWFFAGDGHRIWLFLQQATPKIPFASFECRTLAFFAALTPSKTNFLLRSNPLSGESCFFPPILWDPPGLDRVFALASCDLKRPPPSRSDPDRPQFPRLFWVLWTAGVCLFFSRLSHTEVRPALPPRSCPELFLIKNTGGGFHRLRFLLTCLSLQAVAAAFIPPGFARLRPHEFVPASFTLRTAIGEMGAGVV